MEDSCYSIIVKTLRKGYGRGLPPAVDLRDGFAVPKGELFGVIGPDGAGKTTLFRLLTTLISPDEGEVTVQGLDIIKDYKGGITAGFWQAVAKLFGSDLKKPYDKDGEDARLEELVGIWEAGEYEALYYSLFWKYPDFIPESFSYNK